MNGANGSTDSGGSHTLGMSHVQRGESNARGDNPGTKTRKTGKSQKRKTANRGRKWDLIKTEGGGETAVEKMMYVNILHTVHKSTTSV